MFTQSPPHAVVTMHDAVSRREVTVKLKGPPQVNDGIFNYSVDVVKGKLPESSGPGTLWTRITDAKVTDEVMSEFWSRGPRTRGQIPWSAALSGARL